MQIPSLPIAVFQLGLSHSAVRSGNVVKETGKSTNFWTLINCMDQYVDWIPLCLMYLLSKQLLDELITLEFFLRSTSRVADTEII